MEVSHDEALSGAILATVSLPLLVLDADLRVTSANDAFFRTFRVSREETIGLLIYDFGNAQWNIPELRRLLGEVLPEKSTVTDYRVDHEFERIGRRIMRISARRIERPDGPDMILVAISDDTETESLRAELIGRVEMADKLIDSVREGLLVLEPDLRVRSASASFYQTFEVEPAETEGHLVYELGNGQWDIPELRRVLEDVLARQRSFDDFEVTHDFRDIGKRVMLLNGRRLDHMNLILLAIRDVTDDRAQAERMKEVARAAHVGMFEADLRAGTSYWSPELRDIVGYRQDDPPPTPPKVPDFVHPEDRAAVEEMHRDMLDPAGGGSVVNEHRIVRPDGEVRWVRVHGQTDFVPHAEGPRPVRIRGLLLDVTEGRRAQEALHESEARLRDSQQRLQIAAEAAGLGIWEWHVGEDEAIWEDERIFEIFGVPRDAPPLSHFQFVRDFLHPDDREHLAKAIADGLETGAFRAVCRITRASDGALRWIEFAGRRAPDARGTDRLVGTVADVTERKRAEERQNTLAAELDHRVKNILAVVQSIARQSLGRGEPIGPEAADRLVGRLNSLARSHALLAGSRWEGTCFDEVLQAAVAPYRGTGRVVASGPELKVTPKGAQTLNMAFHELVTNAAKYGALSRKDGRVTVEWHFAGEGDGLCLVVTWTEQDGPEIEAPPTRKGFGSRLIEQMLTFELGGKVALDYARGGLRAVLELPLAGLRVRDDDTAGSPRRNTRPSFGDPAALRHKKVLLVEDEFLVAHETAEGLESAGCSVTGPVATLTEALRIAATADLDAAVLDVNLRGALVWPAAHALRARGIPMVLMTGYSDTIRLPPEFSDAVRIEKPVRRDVLLKTLAAAVAPGMAGPSALPRDARASAE